MPLANYGAGHFGRVKIRFESDADDSRINPEGKDYLAGAANQARKSEMGLIICPLPNTETTAFIAGPGVFRRQLHVPEDVLQAWLLTYEKAVYKAARNMMTNHPPKGNSKIISIATKEFATPCYRTLYIRADANPTPLSLGWHRKDGRGPGMWDVIEIQGGTTVISAGFGSYPVTFFTYVY